MSFFDLGPLICVKNTAGSAGDHDALAVFLRFIIL